MSKKLIQNLMLDRNKRTKKEMKGLAMRDVTVLAPPWASASSV